MKLQLMRNSDARTQSSPGFPFRTDYHLTESGQSQSLQQHQWRSVFPAFIELLLGDCTGQVVKSGSDLFGVGGRPPAEIGGLISRQEARGNSTNGCDESQCMLRLHCSVNHGIKVRSVEERDGCDIFEVYIGSTHLDLVICLKRTGAGTLFLQLV